MHGPTGSGSARSISATTAASLLDGPDEQAIRAHRAALGVPCGDVHQVDSL
jgi:hypothetical protein